MAQEQAQQPPANDEKPKNPWADDVLGRQEVAKDFTRIITAMPSPFVVSINAGYGRGKTFFMERWIQDLKNQGHTAFYFNAWENDYTSEPLVAFGTDFQAQLQKEGLVKGGTLKGLGKSVVNIASQMLVAGGNIASMGLVDLEKLNEKEAEEALEKQSGNIAAAKVQAHLAVKNSVTKFREHLEKICAAIAEKDGEEALPIYILIDELDRCRPSFAIEFLEIIKHFFNVSGIVFVIAMDQEQLQHAVKSVYGQGFDGQGYLRRFIDLELSLPPVKTESYVDALFGKHGLKERYPERDNIFIGAGVFTNFYAQYAEFFGLSLRDIERGTNTINIALNMMSEQNQLYYPPVLGFLVAARQKNQAFYERIGFDLKTAESILEEAEAIMNKSGYFDTIDMRETLLECMLIAMLASDEDDLRTECNSLIKHYEQACEKSGGKGPADLKRKMEMHQRAVEQADHLRIRYAMYHGGPPLFYLKEKIDIGAKY